MGKGGEKLQRTQDRHASSIDKAIARERKMKAEGRWKEPVKEVVKHPDDMTFKEHYPTYGKWERELNEKIGVNNALGELRDYHGMKGPQEGLKWIQAMYESEVQVTKAYSVIKEKLMW